jgi:hypothetical protein
MALTLSGYSLILSSSQLTQSKANNPRKDPNASGLFKDVAL